MAAELGGDPARVHGEGAHALVAQALVEPDGEQHVGGLGPAVGHPRVVGLALEVGIVEVDVAEAVAGRREQHDAGAAGGHQRGREQLDEQEVAEVVGAELHLEAVDGGALRAGHHAGVGDEHVEHRVVLDEPVGEGAHAGQSARSS